MKIDLASLPMAQLVGIHNLLADTPATSKTFSQRSKAVDRILKLAADKGVDLDKRLRHTAEGDVWELLPAQPETPAVPAPTKPTLAVDNTKKPAAKKAKEPKPPKEPKGPSIRSVAEGLLMEVVAKDEDKRPVGHSYEVILEKIREQFPGAKTSVACLRWYAVHMRERGTMPPSRPRAVPAKADETPAQELAEKLADDGKAKE